MDGRLAVIRDVVEKHQLPALAIAFGVGIAVGILLYLLAGLIRLRIAAPTQVPEKAPAADQDSSGDADDDAALGQIAFIWWRLDRRVAKMQGQVAGQARALASHLKTIGEYARDLDVELRRLGVVVVDPVGMCYDRGLDMKLISREPQPDLDCEKVIETVSPSVSRLNRPILRAAVVVGYPATSPQQDPSNLRY
jgi:hypothetical protein